MFFFAQPFRQQVVHRIHQFWTQLKSFGVQSPTIPWRATLALIVLPSALFFLSHRNSMMSGDSIPVTLTATTLLREGRSELSTLAEPYRQLGSYNLDSGLPYFLGQLPGGIYSTYPAGMVVFALPQAALAHLLGADLNNIRTQEHLEKEVASWVAALCLGLFFLLARHLADAKASLIATALLAVGSALCSTVAQALWQHGGVIFWLLLALLVEFRIWRRPSIAGSVLQGVALAMMFATRLSSALLILPFACWLTCRSPRRGLLVALLAALAYLPWAAYYQSIYGTPLGPSIAQSMQLGRPWPPGRILTWLCFSTDHGLVTYQPWILLGLFVLWLRRRAAVPVAGVFSEAPPGWQWPCLVGIVLHLGLLSRWTCWWGGDCWGSRLATEVVPLCGLLCLKPLAALRTRPWGWRLVVAAALWSCLMHVPSSYLRTDYRAIQPGFVSGQPASPGSWENTPFLTPFLPMHR
jgi:hypothetical protein